MKNNIVIRIILLIFSTTYLHAQEQNCIVTNTTFNPGESITYELTYNSLGIPWITVAQANFQVKEKEMNNKKYYQLIGYGSSYNSWEWFYKMTALHVSIVDPATMKQIYFKRDVKEPDFFIKEEYRFNWKDSLAYTRYESMRDALQLDTIKIGACVFDLQSILYYARNIDFSKYKEGDKIPITLLLDRKITPLYFRYAGKESMRLKGFGKIDCLKFSIYLVQGTMFHEGENMQLWVTDDKNRIPLQIETPIIVGSIRATLIDYQGLKYNIGEK